MRLAFLFALFALAFSASQAQAYPTYHRLGYVSCQACHYDPIGGGMLSAYGKSVQGTISAFERKSEPADRAWDFGAYARVIDVDSDFFLMQADALGTLKFQEHWRAEAQVGLGLTREPGKLISVEGDGNQIVARRVMVYGLLHEGETASHSINVGRDFLPGGLFIDDHHTYLRMLNRRNVTDYTTQIRYQLSSQLFGETLQLLPFVYGPSFEEKPDNREWGGGFRGEYSLGQTNSFGLSGLYGVSTAIARFSGGPFVRLSPSHGTGLIAEYLYTHRSLRQLTNASFGQHTVYVKPYVSPWDWTELGVVYEFAHIGAAQTGAPVMSMQNVGPSLNIRVLYWVSLLGDVRYMATAGAPSQWTAFFQGYIHL